VLLAAKGMGCTLTPSEEEELDRLAEPRSTARPRTVAEPETPADAFRRLGMLLSESSGDDELETRRAGALDLVAWLEQHYTDGARSAQ
jgi:hypothetical protein